MNNTAQYFSLAKMEENAGHSASALLFYLSSFCASFNCEHPQYPYQTTAKIRNLQLRLGLSDEELMQLVHSYGPLSDQDCRELLSSAICGCPTKINVISRGGHYGTL